MFGYSYEEPISLIDIHSYDSIGIILTSKLNLILIDFQKNRSLRTINLINIINKEQQIYLRNSPIGLYFIDSISSRNLQNIILSRFQQFSNKGFICIIFPRGYFLIDHTFNLIKFILFDFQCISCCLTPNSIICSDNLFNIYNFSLIHETSQKLNTFSYLITNIFITKLINDNYGIICISLNNIDLLNSNGIILNNINCENNRLSSFDIFNSNLYLIINNRIIKIYNIKQNKIEFLGENNFNNINIGENKLNNYNIQYISPCYLSISNKPLFYSICDQNSLFICGITGPLMRLNNFLNNQKLKKINCSLMISHPIDTSLLIIITENTLLIMDLNSYLPQIIPSSNIPDYHLNQIQEEGLFTIRHNLKFTGILNHCNNKCYIYNKITYELILEINCYDFLLNNNNNDLILILNNNNFNYNNLKKIKNQKSFIECYNNNKLIQNLEINNPNLFSYILKLINLGEFFGIIFGKNPYDLSNNPQIEPHTKTIIYKWNNFEIINLNLEYITNSIYSYPYLILSSPLSYIIYKFEENKLEKILSRQYNNFFLYLFNNKLYGLNKEGLFIDNFKEIKLIYSKFNHLLNKNNKTNLLPLQINFIKEINNNLILLNDNLGNEFLINLNEKEKENINQLNIINYVLTKDPYETIRENYLKSNKEEQRSMFLMNIRKFGWNLKLKEHLILSEKAIGESIFDNNNFIERNLFENFLKNNLIIEEN